MTIRIWKTGNLAFELASEGTTENDAYQYFLANSVLWSLVLYYAALMGARASWLFLYEAIVVIVITLLGLQLCYKANGGSSGKHFVLRAVCLSFPIGLKVTLLQIALGWVTYIYFSSVVDRVTFRDPARAFNLLTFLWATGFTALFYWRLWFHISAIQRYAEFNQALQSDANSPHH